MHQSNYNGKIKLDDEYYLIFNNISGSMDVVKRSVLSVLNGEVENKSAIEYLVKRGYFTERLEKEEEKEFVNRITKRLEKSRKSKQHLIILTYNCNLRCKYCYEKHLRTRGEKWLSKKLDFKMIDKIYEVVDHFDALGDDKSKSIALYGGEPLLPENREIVEYIMEKGTKRERRFAIITNGTTLDEYMDIIEKYPIERIQVTIDGIKHVHDKRRFTKEGKGTFDKIISNLNYLVNHSSIQVDLKIALDNENYGRIDELTQYLRELSLTEKGNVRAYLAPVFGTTFEEMTEYPREEIMEKIFNYYDNQGYDLLWSEGLNHYHPLEKIFKNGKWRPKYTYCGAHQSLLFYDPFGNIYPCWEMVGREEQTIGKYYPKFRFNKNYERWINRTILNLEKCKKCQYALLCGGGCAYVSCLRYGTIERENCNEMRLILDKYIPYLYRKYVKKKVKQL